MIRKNLPPRKMNNRPPTTPEPPPKRIIKEDITITHVVDEMEKLIQLERIENVIKSIGRFIK